MTVYIRCRQAGYQGIRRDMAGRVPKMVPIFAVIGCPVRWTMLFCPTGQTGHTKNACEVHTMTLPSAQEGALPPQGHFFRKRCLSPQGALCPHAGP